MPPVLIVLVALWGVVFATVALLLARDVLARRRVRHLVRRLEAWLALPAREPTPPQKW